MDPLEAHLRRQIEHSRDFFWHRVRWKAVSEQLANGWFTVTDVGAGIGLAGDFLADEYPTASYRFVEPIEFLVAELESRFGSEANANDAAGYGGSRYVLLLDVLEHQQDDTAFLQELAAKMDSGSTLILTVPALQRLWSQWDVALGHFRRYNKQMLRELLVGLPFRAREISYLFPEMVPAALLRRHQRPAGELDGSDASTAEFPDLPAPVNQLLHAVGSTTLMLRRWWPGGTSLLAVLDRD